MTATAEIQQYFKLSAGNILKDNKVAKRERNVG